ncbi:MAG: hypothetical protein EXR69_03515 [Myxococcales bacterium]|nr:hypothetical protein [Myxococcales bacterium]
MRSSITVERRWIFWLLVALVVLPTLGLVAYGLSGLKNQHDAVEAQLRERYLLQAAAVEQGILQRLGDEDASLRAALTDVADDALGAELVKAVKPGSVIDRAWLLDDPRLAANLPDGTLGRAVAGLTPDAPLTFIHTPDGGTIALSRVRAGRVVAYRLSVAGLDALVVPEIVTRQFWSEQAVYHLATARADTSATPVSIDSLKQELARRTDASAEVDRPMAPPFDQWRITVRAKPGATGQSNTGTIVVVFVLAALVVTGITLMGRAVAEQIRLARLQTEFVANVSHELRTPLTSIRMFVETLQSGRVTEPERVQECLRIVAEESERLTRKIERVLSWARLEAGRRLYEMEPLTPRHIVAASLAAFQTVQLDRPAVITSHVPEGLPAVLGDLDALVEVFLNLLSNARKYGGTEIGFEARVDRGGVTLSVSDNGPGIPREERKRIFEKFYRPDLLQTRRAEGSGLGLAIVKAIVGAHHGRVTVESDPGKGSKFSVWLPRV